MLIDKTRITTDEVLEIYREFLLGNVTADYQGDQTSYNSLYDEYKDDNTEPKYIEQKFALTDFDRDSITELKVMMYVTRMCLMLISRGLLLNTAEKKLSSTK